MHFGVFSEDADGNEKYERIHEDALVPTKDAGSEFHDFTKI